MPGDTTPVGEPEAITSYEEVEVAVLGEPEHTARLTALLTTDEPTCSAALGIRRTSEMMRTSDMWLTMTFIELSAAVLDPQLVRTHPYGELPVCCVQELTAGNPMSSWAGAIRLLRRFAKPVAGSGGGGSGGGGGGGAVSRKAAALGSGGEDDRYPLGPVLLVLIAAEGAPAVSEDEMNALFPAEVRALIKEREVEPMVLSPIKAEAMVQVYWWAIQTYRRQHPEHLFTLENVQQLVRMILNRHDRVAEGGIAGTGWCSIS